MQWNLELLLYELMMKATISGDFLSRNELSDPSPLGNVFPATTAVSKPDQFPIFLMEIFEGMPSRS